LFALKKSINKKVKVLGPVIKKIKIKKNSAVVYFKNVRKLKATDGKAPTGFWLSDISGKWFPATAEIKGKKVFLNSKELKKPLYIRYAFTGKPTVNLVNEVYLPAYPFRTDSFKP